MTGSGSSELDGFIAKYSPEIAARTHEMIARLRRLLPGSTLLVYDNYNALAVGFATTDKLNATILSVAAYPRWVSLFFYYGSALDDPDNLLAGSGSQVRSIPKIEPSMLENPQILSLVAQAIANAVPPPDPGATERIIIKSVSPKQRPRQPATDK